MFFKRIEIHGFKSFAEPVVIEFDRGITCVVGPNGSGKSNICDAIRWVLGAQSAKALRGDKMEDVIFSGTAARKSRGMAEVTLVIDNEDGELPIDFKEVAITRRMYRSGESEYLINNTRCRMRDIRELIMDTGIGVEGYSIIGQGKISDIISNNTESIREILEETAGIVMYRSRKAEAERKLKNASDNMDRVNDIIGEIEGRIDGLKEDSEKATEYLGLRDRHKELEINITLKNIENIQLKAEEYKDDVEALAAKIDEGEQSRKEINAKLAEADRRREQIDHALEEGRALELALTEELNTLRGKQELDAQKIVQLTQDRTRLEDEIREFAERAARERENAASLEEERKGVHAELETLRAELEKAIADNALKNGDVAGMAAALDEKKNQLFQIQNTIARKQAEIYSMDGLKQTLQRRRETVLAEEEKEGTSSDVSEQTKKEAEEAFRALNEKEEARKAANIAIAEKRGSLAAKESGCLSDVSARRVRLGELAARKKALEEMQAAYEGFGGAVKFIMGQKLPGIHGVVADLIEVPQGYETAIETALGSVLQNVVCEDDATAKKAVGLLKKNNAGRLTFLPVRSIRARDLRTDKAAEKAAGFKGYGTDNVRFDAKYRTIMEYLLGNVIIVDDMDHAVAMSKVMESRARLVTLDGEIINAAGAITGGRYKHKSTNIFERKNEIGELAERIADAQAAADEADEALEQVRAERSQLAKDLEEGQAELSAIRVERFNKQNEIRAIEQSLKEMLSGSERRRQELANIAEEERKADELVANGTKQIETLGEEKKQLEAVIEKDQEAYQIRRAEVQKDSDAITEARIAVTAQESEVSRIDAIAERIEASIREYDGRRTAREDEMARNEKELSLLTRGQEEDSAPIKEKEAQKQAARAQLDKLAEEKETLLAEIEEETTARDEAEHAVSLLHDQKYDLEIKMARQDTQLENAKEKLWDEFEVSYLQAIEFKKQDFVMSSAVRENREIKNRLKELGEVNVGAIQEYAQVKERYDFLTGQREDITTSMDELNGIIRDMDKIIRSRFKTSFDQVVENFENVFRELYGGGHATITLADKDDPFDSEIEISAQPPGKQLKHINLMSGGEKTMTAIALMFAVLKTKPTPCCILDEVEAALDDRNLEIFGQYLKKFMGVQFTLITHQKATMEHADVMYGITMPESGVSRVYSLKMEDKPEETSHAV
ncbi:MAG: chromosome segregation protein SMC [Firmicutes bacterium]|nr:chromosome segregation protein SMC [Bacillota bacterium]